MRNDSKGRDIFYGIIAIATLIVAIIGATLAYFSVTANSAEGAVDATSKVVSIVYNDGQQVTMQASNLIPATYEVVKKVYEANIEGNPTSENPTSNLCVDSNSEEVCSTYRFTVRSDLEKEIKVALRTEHNGFTYLAYAVYDVNEQAWVELNRTATDEAKYINNLAICDNGNLVAEGETDTIPDCYTIAQPGDIKTYEARAINSVFGTSIAAGTGETLFNTETIGDTEKAYDVVLFIKENRGNQNIDQGKRYTGTIVVDVVGTEGQITGSVDY